MMQTLGCVMLFNVMSLFQSDILVWIVAVPVFLAALLLFVRQYQQHAELEAALEQMRKVKRNNIEYELVLKTVKLSTWRLDVPTKTVTMENDFRDGRDNISLPDGITVDDICSQLVDGDRERIIKKMGEMFAGALDDFREQYQMKTRSGNTYWAESCATIDKYDEDGKPLVVVGTTRRIDDQKAIEQALIEARNHAEESDRLKSAFLANMSHEIRTPLNAIVGFSDVLPMAQSEEERAQLVGLIKKNNAHLLRLFDDMVNMSKLEAGGQKLNKSTFSLDNLLVETVKKYSAEAEEKGLSIDVAEGLSGIDVTTDRMCLAEILSQYTNNALKFTAAGSITLGYQQDGGRLRIYVQDTGKGIPADRCNDSLFERFVKVDDFVPGTGLGLSICRSQAHNIGATVGVVSELGKGSMFWVEI